MDWSAVLLGPRLFTILLAYDDDDIPLFVSSVNISVCLDHLFQGIAPVNDRFDLPRLDQLFDENYIFYALFRA